MPPPLAVATASSPNGIPAMKHLPTLALCALAVASPAALAASVTTVMSNLDNPRGLAFGPDGALYVAEAGRGGAGPCVVLRGTPQCYGPTGAVSRLLDGVQERVVEGLPSYADPEAAEVSGPQDVAFLGRLGGQVSIGLGADPAERAGFGPAGSQFGTLVRFAPDGSWEVDVDVSAHEAAHNPAGGPVDSNPFGLTVHRSLRYVADAGANTLLRIDAAGGIATVATFPSRPVRGTDAVPTTVELGPDGAWYVGELTGVPFTDGAARIYRLGRAAAPEIHLQGFKTIIDMAFGADGSLYVLEHATGPVFFPGPGRVLKVAPDGTRTVVYAELERPAGLLVADDGTLYVSNRSTSVLTGEVLRIVP